MKALIIDDSSLKTDTISQYLNKFDITDITIRDCIKNGLYELKLQAETDKQYDLLILDMMFPNYPNGVIHPRAGLHVLREIKRKGWTTPVILCSSDTIDNDMICDFPNVIGSVLYDSSTDLTSDFKELISQCYYE